MIKNIVRLLLISNVIVFVSGCSTQAWYEGLRMSKNRQSDLPDFDRYQKEREAAKK